ncbi:MAG: ABC transporter permease [Oligosphaeraceae bacterium]|nr:ABC transporter permease [Oligosphaeraceae bacterium]
MLLEFLQSWSGRNAIVLLLLAGLLGLLLQLSRREYWRLAGREIIQSKLAVISFVLLCLYALVAVLDSVGWRSPVRDASGALCRSQPGGEIVYDQGLSVLDRLLTPLRTRQEKTYSSPLARVQFSSETQVVPGGMSQRVQPPLRHPGSHLLGTDRIGVDVLYQSLKSIRTGMIIGLLTTLLAVPFAMFFGITAGYYGGVLDDCIQYLYTVMSSIPTVLFIAAFMIIFGQGLPQLCLAMGIASWTYLCRLLRAETLRLREAEFVQAAIVLGTPSWRIILRHIVPNVLHLVLITAMLRFSSEVLAEAALTYLGIGVGADTMSWGAMINDARMELTRDPVIWWKLLAAFIFMLGLVLPANIFGDTVRDALDPKLRTQE